MSRWNGSKDVGSIFPLNCYADSLGKKCRPFFHPTKAALPFPLIIIYLTVKYIYEYKHNDNKHSIYVRNIDIIYI